MFAGETCFVCAKEDAGPVYRVCRCDTVVHADCFVQLVSTVPSHRSHCAVCRHPYTVRERKRWVCYVHLRALAVFTALGMALLLAAGLAIYFRVALKSQPAAIACLMLLMAACACTCIWCAILYRVEAQHACCVGCSTETVREVQLP